MLGAFCCAVLLPADTLLEVKPGTVLQDRWNRKLHTNFSSGSSKTGVEAVSEKGKTIARYQTGSSTLYRLSGAEGCGTENLTFTVLARAEGKSGEGYLLYAGAGSHTKPGLRLGLRAGKDGLQAYGLFVAPSSSDKEKKFASVQMKRGVPDRTGQVDRFHAFGEPVGRSAAVCQWRTGGIEVDPGV